ncbi:MAG: GntR family transcriptional regulator [Butyrivibrio sp.]|nr:GntR family transcriptional regulator [Butyrivibrio sp.]
MAKYKVIVEWINNEISAGRLTDGSKIPSENELAEKFSLSRQTVRHAIAELTEKGVLTSIRGSGTYVAGLSAEDEGRKRIGVILTYVDGYIFPKTIQGIEKGLSAHGYSIELSFTNNAVEKERSILKDMLKRGDVAGLIIEPTKSALPNPNIELYHQLKNKGVQILFVNSTYQELDMPHVSIDDKEGAYSAVKLLIDNGHEDIGCILKLDDGQGHARYSGYVSAMHEAGFLINEEHVVWLDSLEYRNIDKAKDRICERLAGCSGVFCYNDQVAVEVMKFLREKGYNLPEDMSIVSMDDSDQARVSTPQLCSVPHPKEKLGERAAENMVRLIHHNSFTATYEFKEQIKIRDSVMHR